MGSRFYGSVRGRAASEATRQGTDDSGISGHIRCGYLGVQVNGFADGDADVFDVHVTSGSYGNDRDRFAFRVEIDEEGRVTVSQVGELLLDAAIEVLEEK